MGKQAKLHAVWDTKIIQKWLKDFSDASEYLEKLILSNPDKIAAFQKDLNPITWADESFQIVRNNVYDFDGDQLDKAYYKKNLDAICSNLQQSTKQRDT